MRKILRLKKSQQECVKNQKPITQFFKIATETTATNATPSASVNTNKGLLTQSVSKEIALKRKVSSPTKSLDTDITDKLSRNDIQNLQSNMSYPSENKRLKSDNDNHLTTNSNGDLIAIKKSPKKENKIGKPQTPLKDPDPKISVKSKDNINNSNLFLKDSLQSKNERLPLTPVSFENHVNDVFEDHEFKVTTPVKCSSHSNNNGNKRSSEKKKKHSKMSPIQEFICSPIKYSQSPGKTKDLLSPSKKGSTVKALDFNEFDNFGDDWILKDMDLDCRNDLDLSVMQRCEIVTVERHPCKVELLLKNLNNNKGKCLVEGIWLNTPLTPGDIVSILATRDLSNTYCVTNASGLIVLRPDHLVSSTSVVAGVFCRRKAILQERWKGIDSANTAMTIGVLVHELVQKALTHNIANAEQLAIETDKIIKESIQMLFDAGITEDETRVNMQSYIKPLAQFMQTYVTRQSTKTLNDKQSWQGHIDKVLDIEENLCCPQLGLKGKIDATLQVTIHDRKGPQKALVPLEIKSGKASLSAEHRGQLVLYGMMLNLQRNEDPTTALQRGLLLYLRDRVDISEVSCGYPERRDLIMLRNQLVQYLAKGPGDCDSEQLADIEDAFLLLQQKLPDPVHQENACTKCPYLTLCSLHLWHTDGPSVSESHPLSRLRDQALGHLSSDHIKYFLHWTALLKMEEGVQMSASPLHSLWTESAEKRSKRGTCASNLQLKSVTPSDDRYLHRFVRQGTCNGNDKTEKGPQNGDFSIVSIDNRPWIAAGIVTVANNNELDILLERDLSRRLDKDILFHIDTYESYATVVQNLTNLGVLMEDSDRGDRLRRLIIDKSEPEFEMKLPREVGRLGTKLMRSLNIEQQRAVLKALSLKDYALLQGLPGTGKTQTISVLIQMLVGLKQRVLVTAHTHSAVDTLLNRLPESIKIMRLGSSSRITASLLPRSEQTLISKCKTSEELEKVYDSMEVVGVTCLGAAHAMLARTMFDICIVDEATQVLQSTVLRPLFAARKFLLVGDPEQLPPVVRSRVARRLGMEESLFHRLMNEEATSTLRLQYRMNEPLANVANRVAYNGRLKCADQTVALAKLDIEMQKLKSKPAWLLTACSPEPENAALFINVMSNNTRDNNSNKTCVNKREACVVLALVEVLKEGGVKVSDIGVIAPYRDQVSLLRELLKRHMVEVSTVDQFQGRDKSVIIYSCTKHSGQDNQTVKEGEVLNDQRRLAVSVTRAKHKLVIIGNSTALDRYTPLKRLIEVCTLVQLNHETVANLHEKYKTFIK